MTESIKYGFIAFKDNTPDWSKNCTTYEEAVTECRIDANVIDNNWKPEEHGYSIMSWVSEC